MNRLRFWYLRRFNEHALYEELSKPVEGDFVVIQDGPNTSVRVREEELESYVRYYREKGEYCARAYEEYVRSKQCSDARA